MANNIRGTHVSPGIYSRETDITYAVKSLGITTLGLVGETLKGPAFQPMLIENWRDFQNVFGGTSAEKFKGSKYPKYELPYIAKSYLTESNQLQVCRVLGLSGYNAGPAWCIKTNTGMVVAVLRSRGHYEKYYRYSSISNNGNDGCNCPSQKYDAMVFDVGMKKKTSCDSATEYNMNVVNLAHYKSLTFDGSMCEDMSGTTSDSGFEINALNYGKFRIVGLKGEQDINSTNGIDNDSPDYFEYPVSLNPTDKDYILKVLGTSPSDGTAHLYVETLYDVALQEGAKNNSFSAISNTLATYQPYNVDEYCILDPVSGFLTIDESALTKKYVGTRWLATSSGFTCHAYSYSTNTLMYETSACTVGRIYTVKQHTDSNGTRHYYYGYYDRDELDSLAMPTTELLLALDSINTTDDVSDYHQSTIVKNNYDNRYYKYVEKKDDNGNVTSREIKPCLCDLNNYKDAYRYASTPWFVSNIKGDATHYEMNKLFRFHTISDGNVSNNEVKVSIQNIKPESRTFDVVIRDINDSDESVIVLEKYNNCTLIPGDSGYIAYKIGSFDGIYEAKSKYVTVEVNETLVASESVPCGFLGYPLAQYDEVQIGLSSNNTNGVKCPSIRYRVDYDQNIKHRRQYFGLSNSIGVDIDMFTYKGQMAYGEDPLFLSNGFHLDSRLGVSVKNITGSNERINITVDGVSGYTFDCVSVNNRTNLLNEPPIISNEVDMQGSIYENVDLRKFTAYFYGGFDGWDIYRESRTNTDEFKMNNYQGDFNQGNGEGYSFDRVVGGETLGLNQPAITSDWYAYLAGIRQFANPEAVDINVFATPGIDIINNKTLVEEAIEMIEEERADSIYVVTMPDKPFGAEDYLDEMYTPNDIVGELEDTNIDSNYTCTYYPWVKYHDRENNKYIYLPPTKDVVRNMAMTDNTTHPWFAPAGISRGDVNCVRAKLVTKLADEDVLYEGRINPVKTFASDGVKIWGQKNLQIKESQLNRIATRRLLLRLRKLISISCIGLIFEPNDPTTKNKFLSTVTPIMDNIKSNRGISDYRIEVDDSAEARDRRELPVKLYFKPYQALEYITLDFIVTPQAVSFDDI